MEIINPQKIGIKYYELEMKKLELTGFRRILTCADGTYDAGIECYPCISRCATCAGAQNYCTSCKSIQNLIPPPYCICRDGTYDNGTACTKCVPPCATCSAANNCLTCIITKFSGVNCEYCMNFSPDIIEYPDCTCAIGKYDNLRATACSDCH